jgi:hypothetical protein
VIHPIGWLRLKSALRPRSDRAGAAAVEFALVMPLLIVLVFGIIDFGRVWQRQQVITDTAREGARRAVVRDGADKQTVVVELIQDRLTVAGLQWNGELTEFAPTCADWSAPAPVQGELAVSGCGWGSEQGSDSRVVIQAPYPFSLIGPVIKLIGNGNIGAVMLSTNFVMRNE